MRLGRLASFTRLSACAAGVAAALSGLAARPSEGAAIPRDWHYVSAQVSVLGIDKGTDPTGRTYGKDFNKNEALASLSYALPTPPYQGDGGIAKADAVLSTGFLSLRSVAVNRSGSGAGFSSAEAGLGARIFLHGPANVAGVVKITIHVPGTLHNPNTYGDGTGRVFASGFQVYVETGESNGAGGMRSDGIGSMVSTGGDGVINELNCVACVVSHHRPLPATATASIAFAAGQPYVDYVASLYASVGGAAAVTVPGATFSIVLPRGFTATSTLHFTGP